MVHSNCSGLKEIRLTNTVASVNPTRDIDSSCYTEAQARKSEHMEWLANATENRGLFHYSLSQWSISSWSKQKIATPCMVCLLSNFLNDNGEQKLQMLVLEDIRLTNTEKITRRKSRRSQHVYGVLSVEYPSTTMVNSNCKRLREFTTNKYSRLC